MREPEALTQLKEGLGEWATGFDPGLVSAAGCARVVADAAAIRNIAATIESLAAARVAATGLWRSDGSKSAADWLARSTGITASQARTTIDTGTRLEGLEATAAAAKRGELSPAQATAIADAATADPSAETRLIEAAPRESLGELRDLCRRTKASVDPDPEASWRRLHAQRSARTYTDAEGAWHLHATTTVDAGAQVVSVLDEITDELFSLAYRDGRRKAREAYCADALVEMARRARDGWASDAATKRTPRFLALVRADLDALVRGSTEGDELCEISGVGPVPVTRLRELLDDSIIKVVLTRGVDVANVTHLGRGPTAAQKLALLWSQPVCDVQGCGRRARLEVDHLEPWRQTKRTRLDELGHKCEHHHDLKSFLGWELAAGIGQQPMVPPDDPRHPGRRRDGAA